MRQGGLWLLLLALIDSARATVAHAPVLHEIPSLQIRKNQQQQKEGGVFQALADGAESATEFSEEAFAVEDVPSDSDGETEAGITEEGEDEAPIPGSFLPEGQESEPKKQLSPSQQRLAAYIEDPDNSPLPLPYAVVEPREEQQQQLQEPEHIALPGAGALVLAAALGAVSVPGSGIVRRHWRSFLAGAVCCSASHTATVPIDVVKTSLQCAPDQYRGALDALSQILRDGGPARLLSGTGATLVGYALQGALKFGCYEALKPVAARALPPLFALVAASAAADVVGSCALAPMEAARIRMVSDAAYRGRALGRSLALLAARGGVGALFAGLPALLCKQVPYTVTQLVSFELLKGAAAGAAAAAASGGGGGASEAVVLATRVGCALAAGVLASLASQPGDTLLSAVNSRGRGSGGGGGVVDMVRIAMDLGPGGLFRGGGARVIHVSAVVMVQLLLYDAVKGALGVRK